MIRRRHLPRPRQLAELPETLLRERRPGPMFDPSTGLALDWQNRYKTLQYGFQVGTDEKILLNADYLRTYLYIGNKDAALDVFIGINTSAAGINGALIIPRGFAEFIGGQDGGSYCPRETINAICPGGTANICIIAATLDPYEIEQEF